MIITNCKVNHLSNPLGYHMDRTVFSWMVEDAKGKRQTVACIVVFKGDIVIADTGWAELDSLAQPVDVALRPRTRYHWTVSVRTDAGEEQTSGENWFETGKLDEPWVAQWIGCNEEEPRHPVFSKKIAPAGKVANARLYICGLGLYETTWNGEKIGGEYLTPYCNDYDSWVQYQTYDITDQLQTKGVLSVTLGNGWYKGRFGWDDTVTKPYYGDRWRLLAEVRLTYADGSEEVIGSDESWMVTRSNITFSNIYDGEHRDDTLPPVPPVPAEEVDAPKGVLTARYSTPVTVQEELPVKEVIHTPVGETVLDLGQNMAGSFRLRVDIPEGQKVRLQFGEVLQGENFYRDNLRSAKAEYVYRSDGLPHVLQPQFTYYGYRYVKVDGIPDLCPEDFTGLVLHSELPKAGTLTTGNELVNRLISNVEWGLRGNFIDVPTDCPQRDERMGWTGDAQVFAPTACYLRECWPFYTKYLHDLALEQGKRNGEVPDVIPSFGYTGCSAAWGDAACIIPWTMYQFYGDITILETQFESMRNWVDYITKVDGDDHGWRRHIHYGDWLALDAPNPKERHGGTDVGYVADAMYYRCAQIVAQVAEILDRADEAARYTALSKTILQEFRYEYFTPSGRCAVPTQTGLVLAAALGLSPDLGQSQRALMKRMEADGWQLKTGFVGTPLLCSALTAANRDDIAFRLLLNEDYPGWLYEVKLGATTVWERWNSLLPDGTISSTGMNSLNHYAYGSVMEWMCQDIAGLTPISPGFRHAQLCPHICKALEHVSFHYRSAAGEWKVSWEILRSGKVHYTCVVPFGCTAELRLPHGDCYELDAGTYSYTYTLDMLLPKGYSIRTPLDILMADPEANVLLAQEFPQISDLPENLRALSIAALVEHRGGISPEQLEHLNTILMEI